MNRYIIYIDLHTSGRNRMILNLRGFWFKKIITVLKGGLVLILLEVLELSTQTRYITFYSLIVINGSLYFISNGLNFQCKHLPLNYLFIYFLKKWTKSVWGSTRHVSTQTCFDQLLTRPLGSNIRLYQTLRSYHLAEGQEDA